MFARAKPNPAQDWASWCLAELKAVPFILSPFDSHFLIFFANASKLVELSGAVQERGLLPVNLFLCKYARTDTGTHAASFVCSARLSL